MRYLTSFVQKTVVGHTRGFLRLRTATRKDAAMRNKVAGPIRKMLCSNRRVKSNRSSRAGPNESSAVVLIVKTWSISMVPRVPGPMKCQRLNCGQNTVPSHRGNKVGDTLTYCCQLEPLPAAQTLTALFSENCLLGILTQKCNRLYFFNVGVLRFARTGALRVAISVFEQI